VFDGANLGIGTTSPGSELTIGNSFASIVGLTISTDDATDSQIVLRKAASKPAFGVLAWDSEVFLSAGIYYDGGSWVHHNNDNNNQLFVLDPGGGVKWYASNNGSSTWNVASNVQLWDDSGIWTNLVRSTTSGNSYFTGGNVGIGTTAPSYLLHVRGAGNSAGSLAGFTSTSTSGSITIAHSGNGGAIGYANIGAGDAANTFYITTGAGTIGSGIVINNGGNVGIGTTNPNNAALRIRADHVSGYGILSIQPISNNDATIGLYNSSAARKGLIYTNSTLLGVESDGLPIYISPSSNNLMVLTTSGRVGINNTSPGYVLHVSGDGIGTGLLRLNHTGTGTNGYLDINVSNTEAVISTNYTSTNIPLRLQSYGNANQLYLATSGNVGIGTTSPALKLHVNGGAIFGPDSNFGVYVSPTNENTINSGYGNDADDRDIWLNYRGYNDGFTRFRDTRIGNGKGSVITFFDGSSGNVGIGTTAPAYKLDVVGTARANGMTLYGFATGTSGGNLELGFDGTHGVVQAINRSTTWIPLYLSGQDVRFNPGGVEKVRIDSNGSVGIGTTSPTARLTVTGQGTGTALIGNAGFSSNYTGISLNNSLSESNYNFLSSPTETTLYINRPSGASIRFREANSDQVIIATGGNVGINTTSPDRRLQVTGGSAQDGIKVDASTYPELVLSRSNVIKAYIGIAGVAGGYGTGTLADSLVVRGEGVVHLAPNGGVVTLTANNGNVGIGTTAPSAKLHVAGTGTFTGNLGINDTEFHLRGLSDPTHMLYYVSSGDVDVWEYNTKLEFRQYNGGGTRLVRMGFTSAGTMTVAGDVVAYGSPSDITLKTNIKPLESSLEKIMKLQGVSFTWKEDTDTNKVTGIKDDIGFIAQDVQEILPELVRKNDNGLLSLRDKGITALLVEAIKEQQRQIENLQYLLSQK
jgi:hypothetical protein